MFLTDNQKAPVSSCTKLFHLHKHRKATSKFPLDVEFIKLSEMFSYKLTLESLNSGQAGGFSGFKASLGKISPCIVQTESTEKNQ